MPQYNDESLNVKEKTANFNVQKLTDNCVLTTNSEKLILCFHYYRILEKKHKYFHGQ